MKAAKPLISSTFSVLLDEPDLAIAKTSIEADLKLLEGILQHRPRDRALLEKAALGYFAYAFAFVEDIDTMRAQALYRRSRGFALRGLAASGFDTTAVYGPLEGLDSAIMNADRKAVPFAFWMALSWGMETFLRLDDPLLLADLPRAEALMRFVRHTDSSYFFGGAPLFFGALNGFRPRMFGGDTAISVREFNACRSIAGEGFLLERVFRARYLYVPMLDEQRFRSTLQEVLDAPDDILPGYRLLTAVAKAKARCYLARAAEWF